MSKLKIGRIMLGMCNTNCYFVYQEEVRNEEGMCSAIVIDPADRGAYIYDLLRSKNFQIAGILLTHGHVDHILGAEELRRLSGAKLYASAAEADLVQDMRLNVSQMFGSPYKVSPDIYFNDGVTCTLADISFRVIATPGHTEGSCCYYFEEGNFLISGDTLFEGSVGRTDLPTGSMGVLIRSIKQKLFVLPDNTIVYPGHGGSTTIGYEKENNPFII